RPIWVHMNNPFTPEADIVNFLKRFVDVQDTGTKVIDRKRVWNGKRRFLVRFRADPSAEDGLLHPPAHFSIGAYTGYLNYPDQPFACRRCNQRGHYAADCEAEVCRRCDTVGHSTLMCRAEPKCNLCGASGHIYKVCPIKARSFAAVTGGSLAVRATAAPLTEDRAAAPAERSTPVSLVPDAAEEEMEPEGVEQGHKETDHGQTTTALTSADDRHGQEEAEIPVSAEGVPVSAEEEDGVSLASLEQLRELAEGSSVPPAEKEMSDWGEIVDTAEAMDTALAKKGGKRKAEHYAPFLVKKPGMDPLDYLESMATDSLAQTESTPLGTEGEVSGVGVPPLTAEPGMSSSCVIPETEMTPTPAEAPDECMQPRVALQGEEQDVFIFAEVPLKFKAFCKWDEKASKMIWPKTFNEQQLSPAGIVVRCGHFGEEITTLEVKGCNQIDAVNKKILLNVLVKEWLADNGELKEMYEGGVERRPDKVVKTLEVPVQFLELCAWKNGNVQYPPRPSNFRRVLKTQVGVTVGCTRTGGKIDNLYLQGKSEASVRHAYMELMALMRQHYESLYAPQC
ncbi:ZCHC3 protein, partial [Atractosteus spatula]|nr:ZCHC3 protein [Atractosteus spatula]